jgi:hypothetical protein
MKWLLPCLINLLSISNKIFETSLRFWLINRPFYKLSEFLNAHVDLPSHIKLLFLFFHFILILPISLVTIHTVSYTVYSIYMMFTTNKDRLIGIFLLHVYYCIANNVKLRIC